MARAARRRADAARGRGARRVVAGRLRERCTARARRRCWSAPGNNGGDALWAGRPAGRARASGGRRADPVGAPRTPGPGRADRAGGRVVTALDGAAAAARRRWPRPTSSWTASSASAAGPGCGELAERRRATPCRTTPWSSPSTCPAASTRTPARPRADDVLGRRHGHVRRRQAVPCCPPTEAAAGGVDVVDIGLDRRRAAAPRSSGWTRRRRGRALAGARARRTTSTRAASSASSPAARPTPAPRCCARRRCRAGAGMVRYVGPPTPTDLVRGALARGRARRRPGPGLGGRAGARPRRRHRRTAERSDAAARAPWPRACRASWTPVGSTCSSGTASDAPTLLTPHAGELARLLAAARRRAGRARRRRAAAPVRHARRPRRR